MQGESGILVTITGENWAPNDTAVVRLEDAASVENVQPLFANVKVASDGSFIASFILPASSRWATVTMVLVTVESSASGQQRSAEFSIIPGYRILDFC